VLHRLNTFTWLAGRKTEDELINRLNLVIEEVTSNINTDEISKNPVILYLPRYDSKLKK
jgi:hypothetical protein